MKTRKLGFALVIGLLFTIAPGRAGAAEAPLRFSQHGRLLDGADQPVTAIVDITVSFHRKETEGASDYAANLVWKCRHKDVQVTGGVYGLLVGSGEKPGQTGVPCDALAPELFDGTEERWMSVAIDDGLDMQPRLPVGFVPWAVRALRSADADTLGTHAPAYYAARSALADGSGTINAAANPVDWSQLKGVPADFADGTDDGNSYVAGAGLELNTGTGSFSVGSGALTSAMLASEAASLSRVSGGAMTATAGGNVGVGTASPIARLDVAGAVLASSFEGDGSGLTGVAWSSLAGKPAEFAPAAGSIYYVPSTGGTVSGGLNVTGNVGIGTTSPAGRLQVHSASGSTYLKVSASTTGDDASVQFNDGSANNWYLGMLGAGGLQDNFSINRNGGIGGMRLTITGSGNVGIGTPTPVATLDVGGTQSIKVPVGNTAQRPSPAAAGMVRFNSETSQLEFSTGTSWVGIAGGAAATGGTVTTFAGSRVHTFTASGTFTVTSGGRMDFLMVAGGGAGGGRHGGGGGGGGVLYVTNAFIAPGNYPITVGAGAPTNTGCTDAKGANGSNSTAFGETAVGGGGGGAYCSGAGLPGGSGGGTGHSGCTDGGGAATQGSPIVYTGAGYGNAGANNPSGGNEASGGGGAGAAGQQAVAETYGGAGGAGRQINIDGNNYYWGGGGGGGLWANSAGSAGAGGLGGGGGGCAAAGGTGGAGGGSAINSGAAGATAPTNNANGGAGGANTGGGGGGSGQCGGSWVGNGGAGGSGIVIIRYSM